MRERFSSFEGQSVAEAHLDETQVSGRGGAVAPLLSLPVRLDVSHGALGPRDGVKFVSLQGKLWTQDSQIAGSQAAPVDLTLQKQFNQLSNRCDLEFTLDTVRINSLESLRLGGDLKLRLDAVLKVHKLRALKEPDENQALSVVWGYMHTEFLQLQKEFTIPRDVWISRVLPKVGYGVVHIVELPAAPLKACEVLDHSFKALKQAEEKRKLGFYDDAVGKCRVALEQFFETVEVPDDKGGKHRVPELKKSWKTKLGQATYDWLNKTFGALKEASNRTHHSPNVHYNQFDSQMILAITTAVVAYAARAMDPEERK